MEGLREVLDALPDPALVVDEAGIVRFANGRVEPVLGYASGELEGAAVETLLSDPHRESHAILRAAYMRDPEPRPMDSDLELYARRGDDAEIPVTIGLGPIERDGERLVIVTLVDVSREREREAELHRRTRTLAALQEATQELLKTTDRDRGAEAAVEYVDDVLDLPIAAIWLHEEEADVLRPVAWTDAAAEVIGDHPTFEAGGDSLAWDAFRSGNLKYVPDTHEECRRYNPETPIRSEIHVPLGRYGVLTVGSLEPDDFTEADRTVARLWGATVTMVFVRIERERKLRVREEEVARERDRLEQFASLVSHDLRNPLNVAAGNLELARDESDSEELRAVAGALERMGALVEDMLTLARQGDAVDEAEPVRLVDLAEECRASVGVDGERLHVVDATVRADRSRLAQVFENLFRNASEHAGEDVRITVDTLPDGDGFYVADDGPGIDPERREEVFEAGVTTNPDGTGFGLKIVSEIVDVHDWTVTLREGEAGGARFEFRGVEFVTG